MLSIQNSFTDLQTFLVPMKKNQLHISSWSRVASCKLTNISNSKFNKMKLVSDVLLLNSSHSTTAETHDEFILLSSHIHDKEVEWGGSFKVLKESFFIEWYWEWVEDVFGWHGNFIKGCNLYEAIFVSLFSYDHHASVIRAFGNIGVLPLILCILLLERFLSPFETCITSLGYLSLDLFMMRWYQV